MPGRISWLSCAICAAVVCVFWVAPAMADWEDFVAGDLSVAIAPTSGSWDGVTINNHFARGEIRTYFGFIGPSHTWTDAPPPFFPIVATEEHSQSVGPNHELVRGEGSVTPGTPMQLDTNAEVRIGADDSSGVGHRIEFEGFGVAALDLLYNGPNPTFEVTINAICSYTVDFNSPEGTVNDFVAINHVVALREYEGDHMMDNVLPISGDFMYGGDDLFGPEVSFSRSTPQDEGEIDQGIDLMGQWTFDLVQGQKYALVIGTGATLGETIVPEPATLSLLAIGCLAMLRRRRAA